MTKVATPKKQFKSSPVHFPVYRLEPGMCFGRFLLQTTISDASKMHHEAGPMSVMITIGLSLQPLLRKNSHRIPMFMTAHLQASANMMRIENGGRSLRRMSS